MFICSYSLNNNKRSLFRNLTHTRDFHGLQVEFSIVTRRPSLQVADWLICRLTILNVTLYFTLRLLPGIAVLVI